MKKSKKNPYSKAVICRGMNASPTQLAITGSSGCGKTTLMKILEENLKAVGYVFASGGKMTRELQVELGYKTIGEFVRFLARQADQKYDREIDQRLINFVKNNPQSVLDARLSYIFMPDGFKVLLTCPLAVRAERACGKSSGRAFEKAYKELRERDRKDNERNKRRNPGCVWRHKDFDLVLSTEKDSPRELFGKIVAGHALWLKKHKKF